MAGPRVVIIGAGVVGAALADELTERGWTDLVVVDQGELPAPGGSSSHAPGLVFQASPAKTMTDFARYTVAKLSALSSDAGPCYLPVGGLEVATSPERAADLQRRAGWLASWGVDAQVVDAAQTAALHPMLDPTAVLAGLHNPTDGIAKAVRAVDAQTRRAAERGARLLGRTRVLDVRTSGGRVSAVLTDAGELPADVVLCCAGIWGPTVSAMVGMTLPLLPLAHQLAWTTPLPHLAGASQEVTLPVLRHQGQDLYYRERFDTLGIGYYGHRVMPVRPDAIASVEDADVMPSVQPFTADDFAEAWKQTQALLPGTRAGEIAEGINGLFSFTTDGLPLMGPASGVDGFWVAEAVWVTHSCGVAKAMAQWLVDGHSASFDLHACDVNRFEPHALTDDFVTRRSAQNFVEVYDLLHPLEPPELLRPLRTSPFYERQRELGAVFLEANGWERPQWYGANASLVAGREVPTPGEWGSRYWSPIMAAEAQVTRERVAMYDMTALKRVEVTGPGAADFLQRMTTGDVGKRPGGVTYCLLLDVDGGIRSDITVARLAEDHFQVGANGALDLDWLHRHLPADGTVQVRDTTAGTCCIGLWGPRARDLLSSLTSADVSPAAFGYFRGVELSVGGVPVTALRLSYVGELGWELYTTADYGRRLWDTLWTAGAEHGVIAAGRGAFNSLRLEKGYRSFGTDMTFEHDPWEAGLGFAVKTGPLPGGRHKGDFLGRAAVLERQDRLQRKLTCLVTPWDDDVPLGGEPVLSGDDTVGYVTSASYGFTARTGIAYAWLPVELTAFGSELSISWFGRRIPATVAAEPLVDPGMERIRC